jgi:hypothetical protein
MADISAAKKLVLDAFDPAEDARRSGRAAERFSERARLRLPRRNRAL